MNFRLPLTLNWVPPLVSAAALLALAYQLQHAARPWVLAGSVQQQYYAHLALTCSWVLAGIALAQPGLWHAQRATRRLSWAYVALVSLFLLLGWFGARHQVAVQVAPGVYRLTSKLP